MISPARELAFRILRRIAAQGGHASDLLACARIPSLSERDRRLAYELVLGVLRWQLLLDHLIAHYSRRRPERLDEPVRIALRLGLYQLRFLERIPAHAAVNESVALVKRYGPPWAAGLVNAVLRRAADRREDRPWETIADPIERASVQWSHPAWLLRKWVEDFGAEEALALVRANMQTPAVAIRLNPLAASAEEIVRALARQGIEIEPSPFVPGAYRVRSGSLSPRVDAWQRGWIYIQDEASQLIAQIVAPQPGMRVLELCAAPGSKTTHLAALMENRGMIVAGDRDFRRLTQLTRLAERLHVQIAHPVVLEGRGPLPLSPLVAFERVLLDAPCSGTGTVRRHPEIKWRLTEEEIRRMAGHQKALLEEAARWVAPGGWLIYATCSLEPEEDEEIVRDFLASRSEFRPVVPPVAEPFRTGSGYIRTFPHRHEMDGFFVAVLEKNFRPAP